MTTVTEGRVGDRCGAGVQWTTAFAPSRRRAVAARRETPSRECLHHPICNHRAHPSGLSRGRV